MRYIYSITLIAGLMISSQQTTYSYGMTEDENGRWVNSAGGNIYGDSRVNPNSDPRVNPNADPRVNPNADPRVSPSGFYQSV